LKKYAISDQQTNEYHLYAISLHSGVLLGSGHYTSLCHRSDPKKWFEFNDEKVDEIEDVSSLQSPDAYILFYSQQFH
jgi:ubiquitin C-terminal hydrolase